MPETIDMVSLVRDALSYLSPTCARDTWLTIGMAIHSEFPNDTGLSLWDSWSSPSEQYNQRDLQAAWKSFRPGGRVTLGSLFHSAAGAGWQDPRKNGIHIQERPADQTPAEPPAAEPKTYPPEDELKQLLDLCDDIHTDTDALSWCALRKLNPRTIDNLKSAYLLPRDQINHAPKWAPSIPLSRRHRVHGRLLVPLYDRDGKLKSISGRSIESDTLKVKAARPTGHKASGLCMMNSWAQDLMGRKKDDPLSVGIDVIITEGEPDFLTRCQTHPDAYVFGIYQGSWQTEIAEKIPDGARVFIETDRDQQGKHYAEKIAHSLNGRCRLFRLRTELPPGDVNDMHVHGHLLAPAEQCDAYTPPDSTRQPDGGDDGTKETPAELPEVCQQWQLRSAMQQVWERLLWINDQVLQTGTVKTGREPLFLPPGAPELARLVWRECPDSSVNLEIERMSLTQVMGMLTREFTWITYTDKGEKKNRDPKRSIGEQVHGDAANAPRPLPIIHAVTRTPIYGRSGRLIHKQGYHPEEKLWYEPDAQIASLPEIPQNPSDGFVARAREMLDEAISDFPFIGDAEKATIFAAVLLPFIRRMIDGPTPIHLIESPIQGSGKSLLARIIAIITTGSNISPIVLNHNEEESQKALAAELTRGRAIVLIDNVDTSHHPLNSPALSAIATDTVFTNRKLGQTEMLELPNQCLWLMTGNNVKLSRDLVRRFVRCRLDPGDERPWMRPATTFKHPNIIAWVTEHRLQLVWSALVLCQAWIARGHQSGPKTLGSYESWSAIIGGILQTASIPGFLDNAESFYGFNEDESDSWAPFILQWWKQFGRFPQNAKILNTLCNDNGLMVASRGDKSELSQAQRLGRALQTNRERIIEMMRLCAQRNTNTKNWEYYLEPIGDESPTVAVNIPDKPLEAQTALNFAEKRD